MPVRRSQLRPRRPTLKDFSLNDRLDLIVGSLGRRWNDYRSMLADYVPVREELLAQLRASKASTPFAEQLVQFTREYGEAALDEATYDDIRACEVARLG